MTKWFTIVCLGDSLTVGYQSKFYLRSNTGTPYTYHLEKMVRTYMKSKNSDVNVVVINKGINGDSTDGMLSRLPSILSVEKPDLMIIWAGINDLSAGRNSIEIIQNIAKMVHLCADLKMSIIICSLTPVAGSANFNQAICELNELIFGFCKAHCLTYIDLYSPLSTAEGRLDPANSNDGVHLSNLGYRVVSEIVYKSIKQKLEFTS